MLLTPAIFSFMAPPSSLDALEVKRENVKVKR